MNFLQRLFNTPPRPVRLSIQLVPQNQWGANLSQTLAGERWDLLRRATYKAASYRCQVCGGKGPKWPVEAHEEWEYNDATGIQRLVALVALCPACHEVKHIGRASRVGRREAALRHLIRVNIWSLEHALQYIAGAFATWEQRSARPWCLDLSLLAQYGVAPPSNDELAASASAAQATYATPLPTEQAASDQEARIQELLDTTWEDAEEFDGVTVRALTDADLDSLLREPRDNAP